MLTLLDEHEEDADEESLPGRAAQHPDPAAATLVRGALGALELLDCAHYVRVGGAEALLSRDGLVAVARHDVVPAQRPHNDGQRGEGTSAHSREGMERERGGAHGCLDEDEGGEDEASDGGADGDQRQRAPVLEHPAEEVRTRSADPAPCAAPPLQAGEEAAGEHGEKAHVMASWKTVPMAPRISVVQSSVW